MVAARTLKNNAENNVTAPVAAVAPPAPENRLADLTARLRADTAKMAERVVQPQESPRQAEPVQNRAPIEQERALAAVAAAVTPALAPSPAPSTHATYGDVSIR